MAGYVNVGNDILFFLEWGSIFSSVKIADFITEFTTIIGGGSRGSLVTILLRI